MAKIREVYHVIEFEDSGWELSLYTEKDKICLTLRFKSGKYAKGTETFTVKEFKQMTEELMQNVQNDPEGNR